MNVSLTPELETMIHNKVQSGLYNSASEVVREALRLLEEQDRIKEMRLEDLRREIQKGLDEVKAGRYTEINSEEELREFADNIIKRGKQRLEDRKRRG